MDEKTRFDNWDYKYFDAGIQNKNNSIEWFFKRVKVYIGTSIIEIELVIMYKYPCRKKLKQCFWQFCVC